MVIAAALNFFMLGSIPSDAILSENKLEKINGGIGGSFSNIYSRKNSCKCDTDTEEDTPSPATSLAGNNVPRMPSGKDRAPGIEHETINEQIRHSNYSDKNGMPLHVASDTCLSDMEKSAQLLPTQANGITDHQPTSIRSARFPDETCFNYGPGGSGNANQKSVSFKDDKPFRPSYEDFTPKLKKIQYIVPEKRTLKNLAPPSSVTRPNYHDAIRRISVVLYQHIQNCELRLEGMKIGSESSSRSNSFDPVKADLFHENNFISPKYRCTFVRAAGITGGLPGIAFAMSKVKSKPSVPGAEEIFNFVRTLFNKACLSSECALVCLIYIERLMEVACVPLLSTNWKPVVLCGLLLASKVWQDLSSWNVEFTTIYPEFSLRSINRLEHIYLAQIKWELCISASLYAKYYFALRSLAEERNFRRRYNCIVQIDAPRADRVEERSRAFREEAARLYSKSV